MKAAMEKIKFLTEYSESVGLLNTFRFDRRILNYQYQILKTGKFEIFSPYSGRLIEFQANFLCQTQKVYYLFNDDHHIFFLVTDDIGWGWPLRFLILPAEDIVFVHDNNDELKAIERTGLLEKAKLFHKVYQPKIHADRIRILLGHPNFAHYLWNEISALDYLLTNDVFSTTRFACELKILFQPLGPVEKLIDPDKLKMAFSHVTPMKGLNEYNAQYEGTLLRVGARWISNQLNDNLKNRVKTVYGGGLKSCYPGSGPVFWISVKDTLSKRVCVNQLQFLNRLILKISKHYPQGEFIVDAFSFPVDYHENPMYDNYRRQFESFRISAEEERHKLIDLCLGEKPLLKDKFILTENDSLYSSIYYGQFVDFYICHAGTLQHKIGWIYSIPGIIHLPQALPGHARYHMNQTENSADVFLLPSEFIIEDQSSNQIHRNRNYFIRDVDGAIRYIVNKAKVYI